MRETPARSNFCPLVMQNNPNKPTINTASVDVIVVVVSGCQYVLVRMKQDPLNIQSQKHSQTAEDDHLSLKFLHRISDEGCIFGSGIVVVSCSWKNVLKLFLVI